MEAIHALELPESYEPKLGRHAGKTHSNVHKPQSKTAQITDKNQNSRGDSSEDDEDDEGDDDDPRPPKKRLTTKASKLDSGFQDSNSETDLRTSEGLIKNKHVAKQSVSHVASEEEEDSDLEIEPPAAV